MNKTEELVKSAREFSKSEDAIRSLQANSFAPKRSLADYLNRRLFKKIRGTSNAENTASH